MKLRISVLGAGSFGTTMAHLTARNAPTLLWCRRAEVADEINTLHSNERYLPGYKLDHELRATPSMEEAVRAADLLVVAVPSHTMRDVVGEVAKYIRPWVPLISLAKGLERGTHLRMTQVMRELLPSHRAGVLTGPNLAKEILDGYAAASVIAFDDAEITHQLQAVFQRGRFRVYSSSDVTGCELGGALKNVYAIASGMGDGLGVGDNTRSLIITRGLAELSRLGVAMGGLPASFSGLAGMGDLIATCSSRQSRNRFVGEELGKGRKVDEIVAAMNQVAEGVKTAKVVVELGEKYGVPLPIATEVYKVLYEGSSPMDAYRGLTRLPPRTEDEPG